MFPIKYIDNNLVWNKDNEVFAYYELIPYKFPSLLKMRMWKRTQRTSPRRRKRCV